MTNLTSRVRPLSNPKPAIEPWPLSQEIPGAEGEYSTSELNPQMTRAIIMIVEGKKTADIADELGVHRVTIYRWTTTPEFQRELNLYRERLIEETFSLRC